jgi:tRNA (adenine22-N1)-methyltransferase
VLRNSKRIDSLIQLVPASSQVVWDLCCDHGHIGLGIIETHVKMNLIFVDQVVPIIEKLKSRLNPINASVVCKSATLVNFEHSEKCTFLIAGVGGDLAIKIIQQILRTNLSTDNSFIISPHNRITLVREYLKSTKLKLRKEILVKDNNKFYEMLLLDFSSDKCITSFGKELWDDMSTDHKEYIAQEVKHLSVKAKYSKEPWVELKYVFYKNLDL